jgi:hypothetical protein
MKVLTPIKPTLRDVTEHFFDKCAGKIKYNVTFMFVKGYIVDMSIHIGI